MVKIFLVSGRENIPQFIISVGKTVENTLSNSPLFGIIGK